MWTSKEDSRHFAMWCKILKKQKKNINKHPITEYSEVNFDLFSNKGKNDSNWPHSL